MIVIFDIDDVLMPWAEKVHAACIAAGLNPNNSEWTQWEMWQDYGCTKAEWIDVVNGLVKPDGIYHAAPYPGVIDAMNELNEQGHEIHLVTARGFFDHAEEIRQWTADWVEAFEIPHFQLWFAQDKGEVARQVAATHAIDDRWENVESLLSAGVEAYLMTQPHNRTTLFHRSYRVDSVVEFVDRILA